MAIKDKNKYSIKDHLCLGGNCVFGKCKKCVSIYMKDEYKKRILTYINSNYSANINLGMNHAI